MPHTFDELQIALIAFLNESHTENRDILHRLESLHYSLDQLVVVVAGIQGVDLLSVLNNNLRDSDIERGVQQGKGAH